MNRDLKGMTNEELWHLFPVILSEHQPEWKAAYLKEEAALEQAIGAGSVFRISHIGSTAIPNLIAKPTIDILVEINNTDLERLVVSMQSIGYICSEQPGNPAPHLMFLKGYTPQGFQGQAFHVHVRYRGDWDEIYFRDYLLANPEVAAEYGKLKLGLHKTYEHDRDAYTAAKTEFITRINRLARAAGPTRR
jgi:GrpB-like predicted nucleotidyltransferase (UPF0157 family)